MKNPKSRPTASAVCNALSHLFETTSAAQLGPDPPISHSTSLVKFKPIIPISVQASPPRPLTPLHDLSLQEDPALRNPTTSVDQSTSKHQIIIQPAPAVAETDYHHSQVIGGNGGLGFSDFYLIQEGLAYNITAITIGIGGEEGIDALMVTQ